MRFRLFSAMIASGLLGLVAMPAKACTPATYYFGDLLDPDEQGIDVVEKARRETQLRAYFQERSAQREVLRADSAAHWPTIPADRQAGWLVQLVVPDAVVSDAAPCNYGPFAPQPGDPVYRLHKDRLMEDMPLELGMRGVTDFMLGYQDIAVGCNRELHDRLVPALLEALPQPTLSRVVGQVASLDFYPPTWGPDAKLFRYAAGPGSALELIPREWAGGNRPPLWEEEAEARFRADWPRARLFWQTDSDAAVAIAAIERALTRLRDDSQPYGGSCPQTAARIEALAQDQRDRWPQLYAELPADVRQRAERRRQMRAARGE